MRKKVRFAYNLEPVRSSVSTVEIPRASDNNEGMREGNETGTQDRQRTIAPCLKGLLLCRNVYTDEHGDNTYEGEFRTLRMSDMPAVSPPICVVTKWGDGVGDAFRQEIRLIDPDRSLEIFNSSEFESDFGLPSIYHEHVVSGFITGVFLPREGRYLVEVWMDGEMQGRSFFNVAVP